MSENAANKLAKRAVAQVGMLSAQFLLGMAVNLIGLPKETSGLSKGATTVFLSIHGIVGLALLMGSLLAVRRARSVSPHFVRDAWIGVGLVVFTLVAGLLTLFQDNNWWSYLMAVGFLAALLLYGAMFVYASRQAKT